MTALTTRAAELAEAVESYLTAGSFGDGRIVAGTAAAYYRGAGRACARECGLDPALLAEQAVPHLESVRRPAVDDALRFGMAGDVDAARAALDAYRSLVARAEGDPDLHADSDGVAGAGPRFPRAGYGHWLADLLVERFDATTTIDGRRVGIVPEPVDAGVEAARERAVALARRSLPRLADDLFRGVPSVLLYRADQPYSGYTNVAPLFVFVARQMFDTDHIAAELLVHECLHQKLNDISVTRAMFRPDYHDAHSARISVPWSFGSTRVRHFSADRSFAAFHVYSHQILLYLGMYATATTPAEEATALENLVPCWARAAHFATALADGPILAELGPDGHRFVAWLSKAVTDLGEFRLPDGSALREHPGEYAGPEAAAGND